MLDPSLNNAHILMVDDQESNLLLLEDILEREGYSAVRGITDPRQTLVLVDEFQPDLILLDLHMPQLDGFALLAQLADRIPPADYLPILVLTADITTEAKRRALAAGARDFLTKPIDVIETTLRIRNLLETRWLYAQTQRALEREQELSALKSRFISMTSHEFRTPLTTILSSAEMLEHYSHKWPEARKLEHLRRIQRAVKQMTALLDDVLMISRAEAGRLTFAPAPLDLAALCGDLAEAFQFQAGARHAVNLRIVGECANVSLDERLVRHILGNVLSNAVKYSPQGGEVAFEVTCAGGQALFRVQDHGIGIPLADQARLFESFHRASNVGAISGTGLGLSIVKRAVEAHGGAITVESQVGVGTAVTVTLPIDPDKP